MEKWTVQSGNLSYIDTVIVLSPCPAMFVFPMTNFTETKFRTTGAPMTNLSPVEGFLVILGDVYNFTNLFFLIKRFGVYGTHGLLAVVRVALTAFQYAIVAHSYWTGKTQLYLI